ncbi:MAG: beta-eliminating lyase, partial [Gammaproteobacteria bacterium]|nr:beta-eliminating lyase [Gammaproteobacteria bacterium]
MKSFASDNYSGICPEIMQAIQQANQEHVSSYGNDPFTHQALTLLKQTFGENIVAYFVYNGTAANTLALKSLLRSHHAVITTDCSHIITQEVGAVANFTGSSLI